MTSGRITRRLAAIMATDVVGYSRLMERDEDSALAAVKALHSDVLAPNVERHGGRIFKFVGDGALVTFESVSEAVACAIAIQAELRRNSHSAPQDEQLLLRIGVNLADVLIDGSDLFGDGVNIAARLEAIAPPGGICVTDGVHRQVAANVRAVFEDGGEIVLKNIERPVHVWHWPHTPAAIQPIPPRAENAARADDQEPASNGSATGPYEARSTAPEPPQISFNQIVVRIAAAALRDKVQRQLAEQIAATVGLILSELRWISVVDAPVFGKGSREASREPAFDYSVAISLYGTQQLKLNVKLASTRSMQVISSAAFDIGPAQDFEAIDAVASEIASLVEDRLVTTVPDLISRKPREQWSAYENFLFGRQLEGKHLLAEAEPYFRRATELDPRLIYAYAGRALALATMFCESGSHDFLKTADRVARAALSLDNNDASAHYATAVTRLFLRDFTGAKSHYAQAMQLAPSDFKIKADHAELLLYLGELDEAERQIETCFRKTRHPPVWFWVIRGAIVFQRGRYDAAIANFENIPEKSWRTCLMLAAAHRLRGDDPDTARHYQSRARSLQPQLSPDLIRATCPFVDAEPLGKLLAAIEP